MLDFEGSGLCAHPTKGDRMSNDPFPADWKKLSLPIAVISMVISTIIDAVGPTIAEAILSRVLVERDKEAIVEEVKKSDQTSSSALLPDTSRVQAEGEGRRGFGEKWERKESTDKPYSVNTPYQAPSDGFIAAYTGGNSPAPEAMIYVGVKEQTKISFQLCSRMQRYDGAICPVPKGSYWKVTNPSGGSVTIRWLSVTFSG